MTLQRLLCLAGLTGILLLPTPRAGNSSEPQTSSAPKPAVALSGIDCDRLMRELDTDRDSLISRQEWNRYFINHDDDRDEALSRNEIQAPPTGVAPAAGQTSEKPEWVKGREALFDRLDANHDGTLSRNEWPASDRSFRIMDANADKAISREEFLSTNGRFWNQLFEDWDSNQDGVLARSEWLDTEESFNRLDTDRNGILSRQEFYLRP
jgi:Ca2+-binding EF-hand superfamily protein